MHAYEHKYQTLVMYTQVSIWTLPQFGPCGNDGISSVAQKGRCQLSPQHLCVATENEV